MSRHSKWAKIKRQKAVTDVRRGQHFTKLSRAISVAAREGGGDPEANVRLRMAVDRALRENMPKDNIQRAIERARGEGDEQQLETIQLEGYGPAKSAVLLEAVTDNHNRTVSEVRKILSDAGGSLGSAGSTQWMFERQGHIMLDAVQHLDTAALDAIDAGALEFSHDEGVLDIVTRPETLHAVAATLQTKGYTVQTTETILEPQNPLMLSSEMYEQVQRLLDVLEDHDDIVDVVTNALPHDASVG